MKKLIALCSILAFNAVAQTPQSVLFKVSDIVPLKNADNATVACEFNATFFNRSDKDLSNVVIKLDWEDEVVSQTIDEEKKEEKNSGSIFGQRNFSRTEANTAKTIGTQISLPPMPAMRQVVSKQKIQTDRCFLLLNKLEYQVNSCKASSPNATNNGGATSEECKDIFVFIDSENPEYYTEFQGLSVEEQEEQEKTQLEKDMSEVNGLYDANVEAIGKLNTTINSMR